MKLLLHSCCAPCSIQCVKALRGEGIEPQIFWYNPNIHPFSEYIARRDCLFQFASKENLKVLLPAVKKELGLRFFYKFALPKIAGEKSARCTQCYFFRLEKTASFAAKYGYSAFTTTLLISPYQNHEAIKLAAEKAASKYRVEFLYRDFRPLFREGQSAARADGFYMQKYCGCIFSEQERFSKEAV